MYFETNNEEFNNCEIITFNKFCAIPDKCSMRTNKELIKLIDNDMKNLA